MQLKPLSRAAEAAANASAYLSDVNGRVFQEDEATLMDETRLGPDGEMMAEDRFASDFADDDAAAAAAAAAAADDERDGFPARDAENARLFASVDVREVTGRLGKRARYFVCGISPPPAPPVVLTTTNDVPAGRAEGLR